MDVALFCVKLDDVEPATALTKPIVTEKINIISVF